MTSGAVTTTLAAMITPQGNSCSVAPLMSVMATGTVRAEFDNVNVKAKRNSFHVWINASKPAVTTAGASSGKNIFVRITIGLAPSSLAASSSSDGNWRVKAASTQIVKGMVKIR